MRSGVLQITLYCPGTSPHPPNLVDATSSAKSPRLQPRPRRPYPPRHLPVQPAPPSPRHRRPLVLPQPCCQRAPRLPLPLLQPHPSSRSHRSTQIRCCGGDGGSGGPARGEVVDGGCSSRWDGGARVGRGRDRRCAGGVRTRPPAERPKPGRSGKKQKIVVGPA
jgi:hypothetical protein